MTKGELWDRWIASLVDEAVKRIMQLEAQELRMSGWKQLELPWEWEDE